MQEMRSIPSPEDPTRPDQLSLCATTTEPVLWSPGAATAEPTCRKYESPCALKAHAPQEKPQQ